ncbi:hypothetical protein F3Y22_tig00112408pilonHSYRG00059 [Hibiscus syriacus]|uniref:Uncharacterized protein n=1 Tax=Hibiscus syriacus TaxID=106335 RepID=A0A6A2Y4R2_HIBSY|nr:hypothetical protein F3Y22_tig00112408pilonHSYRG00059 [Hibiscus syriacus]
MVNPWRLQHRLFPFPIIRPKTENIIRGLHRVDDTWIHPHKELGIDGLPGSFYRTFSPLVGEEIITLRIALLEGRTSMAYVNENIIVLIQKVSSPKTLKQYRSIALCTVIYKIVREVPQTYGLVSSQFFNYSKSPLCFGANTTQAVRESLGAILGVRIIHDPGRYLGAPLIIGCNKSAAFEFLRDKLISRVRGWTKICYLLGDVRFIFNRSDKLFLPISWVAIFFLVVLFLIWRLFSAPTDGLILQRIEVWRCIHAPTSLLAQVFAAKYFPNAPVPFDLLIWSNHSSGVYSICSGYFYLLRQHSSTVHTSPLWLFLSNLLIPPKIRMFGWRMAHEALPIGRRLQLAGLSDGLCPICGVVIEICMMHFVIVKLPGQFCKLLGSLFRPSMLIGTHVWNRRNMVVHEGRKTPGWQVLTAN